MLNKLWNVLWIMAFLLPVAGFGQTSAPGQLTLQGVISDTSDVPLPGTYNIRIQIMNQAGSCALYQEDFNLTATDAKGLFAVYLGQGAGPLYATGLSGGASYKNIFKNEGVTINPCVGPGGPAVLAANEGRSFRFSLDGGVTWTGSVLMAAVPYSYESDNAQTLAGVPAANYLTNATVLAGDVSGTSGAVSVNKILGNTVPANAAGVLTNNGAGVLTWSAAAGGITQLTGDVTAGPGSGSQAATISNLAVSKLAPMGFNKAVVTDGTGHLLTSATTDVQIGYLSTATSDIQTQINGKQASLGYTPVNKAGDTMTGALNMSGAGANIDLGTNNITSVGSITATGIGVTTLNATNLNATTLLDVGVGKFHVDVNGNITMINNVPLGSWPANAAGVLTNNGAGVFTYTTPGNVSTGALTAGTLPKAGGATSLVDSVISESGGKIGIGIAPGAKLDVNGEIITRGLGAAPGAPVNGMIYYDTTANKFKAYENGVWTNVISAGGGVTSIGGQSGAVGLVNDTNVTLTGGGSNVTAGWAGTLSIARGGTNSGAALVGNKAMISSGGLAIVESATTSTELGYLSGSAVTNGSVIYGNGVGFKASAVGGLGQSMISNGAAAPGWGNVESIVSAVPAKSIMFSTGTNITGAPANLNWDNVSHRLGINSAAPTDSLDLGGSGKIVGVNAPTGPNEVATWNWVNGVVSSYLPLTGGALSGSLDLGHNGILNVPVLSGNNVANGTLTLESTAHLTKGAVTIAASNPFGLGQFAAAPATGGWGAAQKGYTWFDTTGNQIKYWDGGAIQTLGVGGGTQGGATAVTGVPYASAANTLATDEAFFHYAPGPHTLFADNINMTTFSGINSITITNTAGTGISSNSSGGNAIYGAAGGNPFAAVRATHSAGGLGVFADTQTGTAGYFQTNGAAPVGFPTVLVRSGAGQLSNIFEVQDSGGTAKFFVDNAGFLHGDGSLLTGITAGITNGGMGSPGIAYATGANTLATDNANFQWIAGTKTLFVNSPTNPAMDVFANGTAHHTAQFHLPTGANGNTAANLGAAVIGTTNSGFSFNAGVLGVTNAPGGSINVAGVVGFVTNPGVNNSAGVHGENIDGSGVDGVSSTSAGVSGKSTSGPGVTGQSTNATGVSGQSTSSTGVMGNSSTGPGVMGQSSTGIAGYFQTTGPAVGPNPTLLVKMGGGQTSNILEVQDSGGVPKVWVDNTGKLHGDGSLLTNVNDSMKLPLTGGALSGPVTSTSTFGLADGTAALPAYSFSAAPSTGMYRNNLSNGIGLASAGITRFFADNTGAIALTGNTTANGNLTMAGGGIISAQPGAVFTPSINLGFPSTGFYSPGGNQIGFATQGTQRMMIDNFGYIGMGGLPAGGTTILNVTGDISTSTLYRIAGSPVLQTPNSPSQTLVGVSAGNIGLTGGSNTMVGNNTGTAAAAGALGNTLIGSNLLNNATNAFQSNVLVGNSIGNNGLTTTPGNNNVILGSSIATAGNFSGSQNIILGASMAPNLTGAISNVIIGHAAGSALTTDSQNVIIGFNAGKSQNGMNYNTFVGDGAGQLTTTNGNAFFGHNAGNSNTTGSNNTFLGSGTVGNVAASSNTVAIGYTAKSEGYGVAAGANTGATGPGSVAIGGSAAGLGATASALGAVAIGSGNGIMSATASGISSIAIGGGAAVTMASADGAIAMGGRSAMTSSNAQDAIAIGNGATGGGINSIALGHTANAGFPGAVAIGDVAAASAAGAIQLGNGTNAVANTIKYQTMPLADATFGRVSRYVGLSAGTNGAVGGYVPARALCTAAVAGSHVCSSHEMEISAQFGLLPGSQLWYMNDTTTTQNCTNWTSGAGGVNGMIWNGASGLGWTLPCNTVIPFACCL